MRAPQTTGGTSEPRAAPTPPFLFLMSGHKHQRAGAQRCVEGAWMNWGRVWPGPHYVHLNIHIFFLLIFKICMFTVTSTNPSEVHLNAMHRRSVYLPWTVCSCSETSFFSHPVAFLPLTNTSKSESGWSPAFSPCVLNTASPFSYLCQQSAWLFSAVFHCS